MKAKLIVNNQEIEVEISEEEYKKLQPQSKTTGYERVAQHGAFCYIDTDGLVRSSYDICAIEDTECYEAANYYSSKTVAENNARADKLMRQLRRFVVEHREKELNWNDSQAKYFIYYNYSNGKFDIAYVNCIRHIGEMYFDSAPTAQLAIDTFHDELIWYFTEYKDSL